MRILVIEDEKELCDSIKEGLILDGYEVDACYNGLDGEEMATVETYDLILLDLTLPDMDGMEILQSVRSQNALVPILILSARVQTEDKVEGLDRGANDYLTKPFDFSELEARIRSLTRRKFVQKSIYLSFDGLELDTKSRRLHYNGEEIFLTKKEMGILEYLLLNQERVVSQEEIIEHVWNNEVNEFSNSIRVHISALRKKLREKMGHDPIVNKVGQGYILK
ncbi:MAG: response regulator transcription factor [Ezakiella sp.]|uniref:response regulator transcription factor n=1 Tax=Ezakiella sp. TaxID=1935205 RepID=UPI00297AF655|nr:response regulator transcription factor [Ezakiella sp.]MDD7730982.1 response regulator transcription factor [Eubacteriales bacterium]MDY6080023.1 response regulator transcription factor [Ezakiella sp.]